MRQINEDDSLIRQYLLGALTSAEQQHVEELFISNPEYRENVLIVEEELIEDYLDGALSESERKEFASHFLATPQQRQRLRIAKTLKKYAGAEASASPPFAGETYSDNNGRRKSGHWIKWRNPVVLLPMAATLLIVLVLGAVKLVELRRSSNQREQEQSRRLAVEREVAQLNDPSRPREAQGFAVILAPIVVRDAQASGKVSPPANATVVELMLVLIGEKYPGYRALLQKTGEPEPLTIDNLRAESTTAGQAVVVRLPTQLLTRGDYQVRLLGVTTNGEAEQVGKYDFQLTDRAAP
jgi:hypothetical protein